MFAFIIAFLLAAPPAAEPLKVGVFAVDASPPVGSPLAYDPTKGVAHPLSCRGVVLIGEGRPIVLCAVDWIGIANDGQVEFRQALAEAAGTDRKRVAVHTLHQHDAPFCDFSTDRLLAEQGSTARSTDAGFARDVIARAAAAVRVATRRPGRSRTWGWARPRSRRWRRTGACSVPTARSSTSATRRARTRRSGPSRSGRSTRCSR